MQHKCLTEVMTPLVVRINSTTVEYETGIVTACIGMFACVCGRESTTPFNKNVFVHIRTVHTGL